MLSRRSVLKQGLSASLATLGGGLLVGGCGRRKVKPGPNIILIVLDTLRADHLGCYGYAKDTSPGLDKFASQGILFEDASAPAPWTLPSHASMMTGYYPNRLGLNNELRPMPKDVQTLAQMLSRAGFACAAAVNSLYLNRKFGFDRGFGEFTFFPEGGEPNESAAEIVQTAKKWISRHQRDRFFLFLHFFDPHSNYSAAPEYEAKFTADYRGPVDGSTAQLMAFRNGFFNLGPEDVKYLTGLYDAEINQLDDRMVTLFGLLEKQGLLASSFVIVTSDHGEEFLDHGGVLHGRTQYQELLHVPLMIAGPGIPANKRIREPVTLVDVTPTVLKLAGLTSAMSLEGMDISTLWHNEAAELPERFIFAEADHNNKQDGIKRTVRNNRYKLHYNRLSENYELYDLARDEKEQNDISDVRTDIVAKLAEKLKPFSENTRQGSRPVTLSQEEADKLKSLGYLR